MSQTSRVDLVGVGLNATDTLIAVPHFPARGSKVESPSVKVMTGGQVASAVVACQFWGLRTRYVGKLGDDPAGMLHRKEFAQAGVDAKIVSAHGCTSHQSFILVDADGERTVMRRQDANLALQPDELDREWIVSARALLVDGYDTAAAISATKWARESGISVVADFDEAYEGIDELLKYIDYLIVSRDFPQKITGERDLKLSLPAIQQQFGCRIAAATLGVDGVLAWDGGQFHHACAYRVSAVDTTGAGDIFHAGFIYGLLQDWPLQRQLDFACAAAGLNCTAIGARGGIRPIEEIQELTVNGVRFGKPASLSLEAANL